MAKTKARKKLSDARKGDILSKLTSDPIPGPHRYNAVVDAARLEDVVLMRSQFEVHPDYFDPDAPREHGFASGDPQIHFEQHLGTVVGMFPWNLEVTRAEKPLLTLACTYTVRYSGLRGQDAGAVEAFVRRVGSLAVYPYFRAFASQIGWAAGAELPILPILRAEPVRRRSSDRPPPPKAESSAAPK